MDGNYPGLVGTFYRNDWGQGPDSWGNQTRNIHLLEWVLKTRECKGKIKYKHKPDSNGNGFTEILTLDLPMNERPLKRGINIDLLTQFKEWKKWRLGKNLLEPGIGPWRAGKL